ncbi:MAG: hypothetical protein AAGI92_10205 [Pseudomonadota bacterium]
MGTNRYAYSANDPINKSDPNGHNWFSDLWGRLTNDPGANSNAGTRSHAADVDTHDPMTKIDPVGAAVGIGLIHAMQEKRKTIRKSRLPVRVHHLMMYQEPPQLRPILMMRKT